MPVFLNKAFLYTNYIIKVWVTCAVIYPPIPYSLENNIPGLDSLEYPNHWNSYKLVASNC